MKINQTIFFKGRTKDVYIYAGRLDIEIRVHLTKCGAKITRIR